MSKLTNALVVNYVDEQGRTAKTKFQFDLLDELADIQIAWDTGQDLLAEITGAGITSAEVTEVVDTDPTSPVSGTGTNTSMDKLRWTFADSAGNRCTFETPAPLAADMNSDDYTVNGTQADILAFIDWCKANLVSPYGLALTTFIDAVRTWKNRKAKNV